MKFRLGGFEAIKDKLIAEQEKIANGEKTVSHI